MLKLGICTVQGLQRLKAGAHPKRRVSLALYDSLQSLPAALRAQLQEQILWRFTTASRINKRTYNQRFGDFDELIIECVKTRYADQALVSIHDVGVSDGRTALELYTKLKQALPARLGFLASDAHQSFVSIGRANSRLSVILDGQHRPVQVIFPPFVLDAVKKDRLLYYPLNRLLLFWLFRTQVKSLLNDYRSGSPELQVRTINVIDPRCAALAQHDKDFRFAKHDILDPLEQRFDVIRAMNVLNQGYFSPQQLAQIVVYFFQALANGGLFVTGANEGPGTLVHGSIFAKENGRFVELVRSGHGSPARQLILAVARDGHGSRVREAALHHA